MRQKYSSRVSLYKRNTTGTLEECKTMLENCIGYMDLKNLADGVSAINRAASEQEVAFQIRRICDSLLPCDWGGVGLLNLGDELNRASVSFVSHSNREAVLDKDLPKWAVFGNELLENWVNVRRPLFVDNLQDELGSITGSIQPVNMVFDAIDAGDAQGCFYYLVNIDKTSVSKYQTVMKLLLSSIHATLIRLSHKREIRAAEVCQLTEREKEIIFRIRRGLNNKSIANQLNISVNTVKCHIYNIFQKLQATNRVEALVKAEQAGYINQRPFAN